MQIKCFPDTCKEIYEFGNTSRDYYFWGRDPIFDEDSSLRPPISAPEIRRVCSSHSELYTSLTTYINSQDFDSIMFYHNMNTYCKMTWLAQVYGDVLPGFI